jgi:hypothetical protein
MPIEMLDFNKKNTWRQVIIIFYFSPSHFGELAAAYTSFVVWLLADTIHIQIG